ATSRHVDQARANGHVNAPGVRQTAASRVNRPSFGNVQKTAFSSGSCATPRTPPYSMAVAAALPYALADLSLRPDGNARSATMRGWPGISSSYTTRRLLPG